MMRRRVTTVATKALVFSQKKHLYTQPKADKTQRHPIRARDQKEKEQWSKEALGEKEKKHFTPTTCRENVRDGTLEFLTLFQHLCPFHVWHYLILSGFFWSAQAQTQSSIAEVYTQQLVYWDLRSPNGEKQFMVTFQNKQHKHSLFFY